MTPTALQAQLKSADVADYRGAAVARRFSDPQPELAALLNRCGVYDLGFRTRISLTGQDRVRWLNGMVTNNIRDLAAGHGLYAFLLNPQGHILGDLDAYNLGDSLVVETDRSQVTNILGVLDHYIIMDDVEVADLSDQLTAIGIGGPKTRVVLGKAGLDFPELQPLQSHTIKCDCDCGCPECVVVRGDGALCDSYEIWLAPAHVEQIWNAMLKAGATPAGSEALELRRILSGIPLYGMDIRERDLPQETEQMRALNFSKGCYIGQEIVERIRSRGAVHRTFTGFVFEGATQPPLATKITVGGKDVGEITSAASFSGGGATRTLALGYIRREAGPPGREVTIAGNKAIVTQMPLGLSALLREPVEARG